MLGMSKAIDSSQSYRFPGELVELVEAVTQTDPNNESTWIEWKSTLDLTDKSAHWHIAKHVLGFANRTVALEVSTSTVCRSVLTPPGPGGHPSVGGS